ncbi:flippase [filamentous cyanobacterium LEGE 11480]|uniref:Flippase n=1 Tax=Romeriopsis navalis LEGE 11480 TaxID=2777977 RepID=A0A928Z298_9CYAN|nr:flippase [Romeriopsis navalis]MBE9028802.1 flippase [Romeriopsis navalis LEGE 11480]
MNIVTKLKSRDWLGVVAQHAIGSFGLKIVSLAIAFGTNIFLARLLGAKGFGDYIYALTWVNFLVIPATLGLSEYLAREVAAYQAQANHTALTQLWRWSNQLVLWLSIALALCGEGVIYWLMLQRGQVQQPPEAMIVFLIAMLGLPLTSLAGLRQGAMRGYNQVMQSNIPELIVKPLLLIIGVGSLYLFNQGQVSTTQVMLSALAGVMAAFWFGSRQLQQVMPPHHAPKPTAQEKRVWFRSTLPFLAIVAMFVINQQTDVLMLGALRGSDAAGIYTVVGRGAQLMQFIIAAVSAASGPTITQLYVQQDWTAIRRVLRQSARLAFGASVCVAGLLIPFGHIFLGLFGAEFLRGNQALIILCSGYLLASFLELAGLLLLMSGNERDTAIATGITAGLNIVLNALLIPRFGLVGAATATATSTVARGIYFNICTRRRFGMTPNPFF